MLCLSVCMVCGVCESSKRCSRAEIGSILLGGEEARGGTQGLTVAKSNRASTPFTWWWWWWLELFETSLICWVLRMWHHCLRMISFHNEMLNICTHHDNRTIYILRWEWFATSGECWNGGNTFFSGTGTYFWHKMFPLPVLVLFFGTN